MLVPEEPPAQLAAQMKTLATEVASYTGLTLKDT
jgi:hypothetical protein